MLAAPMIQELCNYFFIAPTYVGLESDVATITKDAVQYVEYEGTLREAVVASAADAASDPPPSTSVWFNLRTLVECTTPTTAGVRAPHQCPL